MSPGFVKLLQKAESIARSHTFQTEQLCDLRALHLSQKDGAMRKQSARSGKSVRMPAALGHRRPALHFPLAPCDLFAVSSGLTLPGDLWWIQSYKDQEFISTSRQKASCN